jgi:hypothetical protein
MKSRKKLKIGQYDLEQVIETARLYVEEFSNEEKIKMKMPTLHELANRLGSTVATLDLWNKKHPRLAFYLKRLMDLQEWYLLTHTDVRCIFLLKARYGYKDTPTETLNIKKDSYDNKSLDVLMESLQEFTPAKLKQKLQDIEQ